MPTHVPPRGTGRILIVDDNAAFRESAAEILRLRGYEVSEAADLEDALAVLGRGDVALLVLDLGLPLGKGLDLLDRVDELPPVILVSGSSGAPIVDPRVSAFLTKPVPPERLLEQVALYMGGRGRS